MKKFLAILLCLTMALVVFAGCGKTEKPADDTTADDTVVSVADVVPEAITTEPLYYWGFEDASGLTAVAQGAKAADSINDGATYDIVEYADAQILIAEGQGAVGNALYLDGKYGVKLNDLAALSDDSYTVSFWLNADRLSTYGPVVQLGRNMGDSGNDRTVTWLNVTKSTWGTNSADLFPVVWNRNSSIGTDVSADGVWPWISAGDDLEHGKREWVLLTLVVDGNRYVADDGMERIGTRYYLNGELKFDASAEFMFYQGVSPEILIGDGVEGYIGINYWDTIYKGFIDELCIYDEALTAGQVLTLFENGNPPAEPVAPESSNVAYVDPVADTASATDVTGPVLTPASAHSEEKINAAAIDNVGLQDKTNGWWTDWSNSFAIADGETKTIKMDNYSNCGQNWNNYVVVFVNSETQGHYVPADQFPGTYAEYAAVRADNFGWGDASYAAAFESSWGDDWASWVALMADAEVTIAITRNGNTITMENTFVGADGTTMTSKGTITSTLSADAPCYFFVTCEGAYVEILSVE